MADLDHLPVAGKEFKKSVGVSTALHLLLLLLVISLAYYSHERVEELRKEKQVQAEIEKKEKLEDAVAEQQLEQDIKDILEELQPDATAEELEDLSEALEASIDKEILKDQLTAAMDEENEERDEAQETYLDNLAEELSEHFENAFEETEDDKLEQELVKELIFEDLPEIDNNIENALKRNSVEEIVQQTLAEKADELINEANQQLSRDARETGWNKEKNQERKEAQDALKKLKAEIKDPGLSTEDLLKKVEDVTERAENIIESVEKKNPYSEEGQQERNEKVKSKLEEAKENFEQAQKEQAQAREVYDDAAKKTLDTIEKAIEQNKEEKSVQQHQETVRQQGENTKKELAKKEENSQPSLNKLQETSHNAKKALTGKTKEQESISESLKTAQKSQKEYVAASSKERKARNSLQHEANQAHRNMLRDAESLVKKLSKSEHGIHEKDIEKLNKAIAEGKNTAAPKNLEDVKNTEKSIKSLEVAKREFADSVNETRKKAIAKSDNQLKSVKELAKEVKDFNDGSDLNTEEIVKAVKEESVKSKINEKAERLRESLTAGTDQEKDERKEDFKLDAKEAVAVAEEAGKNKEDGKDSKEGEETDGPEATTLSQSQSDKQSELSSVISRALAEKMGLDDGSTKDENESEKEKSRASIAALKQGMKVEGELKRKLMSAKWRTRRLSMTTQKEILSKNAVSVISKEPPVLRFAKPTLQSEQNNTLQISQDIYVGKLTKREVATLNPNRPRKAHPKFADTDFCAVPFCTTVPKLDGDPSDWNLEHTRLTKGKDVFMQWRPDGLYVLAIVEDKSGQFESADKKVMEDNFWNFDCMEIWFDMKNSKAAKTAQHACQQFWVAPILPGIRKQNELWEVVWGGNGYKAQRNGAGKNYVGSQVHPGNTGYNIEYFIPRAHLTNLKFFRAGQVIGFLYAINHNSNYSIMTSSLKNYNPNFHYSSQPSSWGNLQLLGTDAALNTLTAEGTAAEYPTVEVSQSLGLMVNDPDSNTDIGAINAVTVRVRNRFGFDGQEKNAAGLLMGDWEDVRLQETGKNTGIFKGWVRTTLLPSTTGDERIGVQPGDVLDVDYNDYVRMAGEYDQKMHVEVQVVSPVYNVEGANKKPTEVSAASVQ